MEHKGRIPEPGWVVNAHVVGEAVLLPQRHKQAARHAHPQVAMQQPQGQGVRCSQRCGAGAEHQHQLLGVVVAAGQLGLLQARWAGLALWRAAGPGLIAQA